MTFINTSNRGSVSWISVFQQCLDHCYKQYSTTRTAMVQMLLLCLHMYQSTSTELNYLVAVRRVAQKEAFGSSSVSTNNFNQLIKRVKIFSLISWSLWGEIVKTMQKHPNIDKERQWIKYLDHPFLLLVSKTHFLTWNLLYRDRKSSLFPSQFWQTDNKDFIFKQCTITKFHYV